MFTEPKLETRPAQPYVAIPASVTMAQIGIVLPPLLNDLFQWLKVQNIAPAGPPFFRYLVIDMANTLKMEVGIPVVNPSVGAGRVQSGILPAGRYAVVLHTGPYEQLEQATAALLAWAKEHGVAWRTHRVGQDEVWDARIETYLTDDQTESDEQRWQTEIAILTTEPVID